MLNKRTALEMRAPRAVETGVVFVTLGFGDVAAVATKVKMGEVWEFV